MYALGRKGRIATHTLHREESSIISVKILRETKKILFLTILLALSKTPPYKLPSML